MVVYYTYDMIFITVSKIKLYTVLGSEPPHIKNFWVHT